MHTDSIQFDLSAENLTGLYFSAYGKNGEYLDTQGKVLYRIADSVYYLCRIKLKGSQDHQLHLFPLAMMQYFKFGLPAEESWAVTCPNQLLLYSSWL